MGMLGGGEGRDKSRCGYRREGYMVADAVLVPVVERRRRSKGIVEGVLRLWLIAPSPLSQSLTSTYDQASKACYSLRRRSVLPAGRAG